MRLGQVIRDPETGDVGRIVGFGKAGQPIGRTEMGRTFYGGKAIAGRPPSFSERYWAGDLKVCNCAGCRVLMIGGSHQGEYELAQLKGDDLSEIPKLVAARKHGRPYCLLCVDPIGIPKGL